MQALLTRFLTHAQQALLFQFLRFGTVGFIGFVVDNGTIYGTRAWLGLYWAGALSFLLAATVTWAVNRIWTFRGLGGGAMHRQWMLFLATNSLGFVLNRGTYFILITVSALCAANPVLATFAGTLVGMFLNFHMSRTVVFR